MEKARPRPENGEGKTPQEDLGGEIGEEGRKRENENLRVAARGRGGGSAKESHPLDRKSRKHQKLVKRKTLRKRGGPKNTEDALLEENCHTFH